MHTKMGEKKNRQIAIRLDPETSRMLDVLCERWGEKTAPVVRKAIRGAYRVEAMAAGGGEIVQPGRRGRGRRT